MMKIIICLLLYDDTIILGDSETIVDEHSHRVRQSIYMSSLHGPIAWLVLRTGAFTRMSLQILRYHQNFL